MALDVSVYLLRKGKKHHDDFSYDCKIQVFFSLFSSLERYIFKEKKMEFEEIRSIISKAIEQTKTHQLDHLMRWLDGILVKYRESPLCTFIIVVVVVVFLFV